MYYFSEFATADGSDLDGERILRERLTAISQNMSGGSSWEIPCRERTDTHPNIVSVTDKLDQEPYGFSSMPSVSEK